MTKLYVVKSNNLSLAWAEVFLQLMEHGASEIAPAIITITDLDERSLPRQIPEIGKAIDAANKQSFRTVASTIFPNSLWSLDAIDNAARLYARYESVWHTIAKCPANNKGALDCNRLEARYGNAHHLSPDAGEREHQSVGWKQDA